MGSEMCIRDRYSKQPMDMCAPVPSQYIVLEVLRRKMFRDIKMRAIEAYKHKRDLMLKALDTHLPELKHTKPVAGMFILLWLPEKIESYAFADALLEKYDVAVIPAARFFLGEEGRNVIRLNFSMAKPNLIDEGVKRIAELVGELAEQV